MKPQTLKSGLINEKCHLVKYLGMYQIGLPHPPTIAAPTEVSASNVLIT